MQTLRGNLAHSCQLAPVPCPCSTSLIMICFQCENIHVVHNRCSLPSADLSLDLSSLWQPHIGSGRHISSFYKSVSYWKVSPQKCCATAIVSCEGVRSALSLLHVELSCRSTCDLLLWLVQQVCINTSCQPNFVSNCSSPTNAATYDHTYMHHCGKVL